jgi:DNA polymerase-3 subunit gamma/tau
VRYAPVSARYKVYIIDEVHMLSTAAFNALLKTLEEPPPHAKFIFATTEIRKVPITILSRCQRFDLRRIDAGTLVKHLEGIAAKEAIEVEPEALALIARAAEGSVRDSLSLLDQGIAHSGARLGTGKEFGTGKATAMAGPVRAEHVRQMLGLADRARVIDLFEALMRGDMASALAELRSQYDIGADPAVVLTDLAEFTHFVTRVKIVPAVADDPALIEVERTRGRGFAEKLSMRVLSRTWQMLLKGIAEVGAAGRPLAAAEMVLVRIAYAADLPTPDEVIRSLSDGSGVAQPSRSSNGGGAVGGGAIVGALAPQPPRLAGSNSGAPTSLAPRGAPSAALASVPATITRLPAAEPSAPALVVARFEELIALAAQKRDLGVKLALERDMRLVRYEDGRLEISLEPSAAKTLVNDLARKFSQWTNRRWMVVVSAQEGQPTVKAQNDARQAELKTGVRADPLVQAVLARFPGAEIVDVRKGEVPQAPPSGDSEEDPTADIPPEDDGSSAFGAHGYLDEGDL